jgi:hypothetical protein
LIGGTLFGCCLYNWSIRIWLVEQLADEISYITIFLARVGVWISLYTWKVAWNSVHVSKHYVKEGQTGFSWLCSSLELMFSCFYLLTSAKLHFVFVAIIILNWYGKCLNYQAEWTSSGIFQIHASYLSKRWLFRYTILFLDPQ